MKCAASEARKIELGKTLEEVRVKGKTTALHNINILEEFGMTAGDWTPSCVGQVDKGVEDTLRKAIVHERIKVSRLERKPKIMAPLLANLRLTTGNLREQVNKAATHSICIFSDVYLTLPWCVLVLCVQYTCYLNHRFTF